MRVEHYITTELYDKLQKYVDMDSTSMTQYDVEEVQKVINSVISEAGFTITAPVRTTRGVQERKVNSVLIQYDSTDDGHVVPHTVNFKIL